MKLLVLVEDRRLQIDIDASSTVWDMKVVIAELLHITISPNTKESSYNDEKTCSDYLHLYFNGTPLHNFCTLEQIDLKSGATIRCEHFKRTPYALKVGALFCSEFILQGRTWLNLSYRVLLDITISWLLQNY